VPVSLAWFWHLSGLTDLDITLIESDQKKCTFLSTVSRETSTPVNVVNSRIEACSVDIIPDIIAARALCSVDKLIGYAKPYIQENARLKMVLLKGEQAREEIEQAKEKYTFDYKLIPSTTGGGFVVLLENITEDQ
jgi:16S rRNA (guanine527-N7)-methyltransferase